MGLTATSDGTQPQDSDGLTATEHRLANGLRVVLSQDHLTPVASVCLWYDVGSRHEVKGRTGLAHLFEHLMFQGSSSVKGNGHFELVQGAGGSLNGTTSFERTNYFETMPAHQVELALWLEADRMGSLLTALDEESLENQRDVVKNERRQRYDNVPYGTAFERLTALAYPDGHPYHHTPIGSMADLDAASLEDARAFFRTYYAPNNAVLAVVGDIDPEQTLAWVEKYFGTIPGHDGKPAPRDGSLPDVMGGQLREIVEEDVPSRALMAAYRLPHDGTRESDAADLALTVLGGGESSRLHNRLVRHDRSAVAAGFGLLRLAGAPSLGWLDIKASSGVELADIEAAVDEELARFAAEGPTPQEMERAQAQLEREWLDRLATVAGRADELCRFAVLYGDPQLALSAVQRVLEITAEEVQAVAAARLRPDNRAVLVYEPTGSPDEAADETEQEGADQ
ncbi:insulinase family protein [Streptomyces sp. SID13666]|uniref:M16 family metallopeptidase n=1 Tax=Streptomyces TaxID=1883 RepID=UPI001105A158|nr:MULTISPECIES: pitrilysin family protein [Streptomyces]MCZ4095560.1 pitrilysin family protein [Streptomyces sp. H39-C1]NEA55145.1 insulinase family protein [Streptomyces sp. SID13666]NEA71152.1 insulinase family protein [Streptomyces sp. SID13588]QNA75782.1 insulinase family protein [Streptomyces sp. So13.3]